MMDKVVGVSTVAYDGYDLFVALNELSNQGYTYVELAAIKGLFEHVKLQDLTETYAIEIVEKFSELGLSSIAFSGHVDLTEDETIPAFRQKMVFAKKIGVEIINTNAGSLDKVSKFLTNIRQIAEYAESLQMIIGLENSGRNGDIIGSRKSSSDVMQKIRTDYVKLNYDFANVFYCFNGRVKPEEDFKYVIDYIAHLHLKDIVFKNDTWSFCEIGRGLINYRAIFRYLKKINFFPPMSIEIPLRLRKIGSNPLQVRGSPLKIEQINRTVRRSLESVNRLLA